MTAAILQRLARPEFASIFSGDGDSKKIKLKSLLGIAGVEVSAKDDVYLDYLIAFFLITAVESAPDVFTNLSQIAFGALIADAVAGLAAPSSVPTVDPSLRVVLDAPLVMDLLDLSSVEYRTYAEDLMQMMRGANLRLAIFDHSVEEIRLTIDTTLAAHRRGDAYGPMAKRLRGNSGHAVFVTVVRDSLESRIKALGIDLLRSDVYMESRFLKWFPEEREDQIRNAIGDLHEHLDARIRDARSVATVARLKGSANKAGSIFEAGTIFLTRNSVLSKRVYRALSKGRSEPDPRFCIATDGQLAGILWFVLGIAGVEISRKRLIANCSAAILPRRDVIKRVAQLLESFDAEHRAQFEALMTDNRASLCPMRMTGGYVDAITQDKSLEILEEMKKEISVQEKRRADKAEFIAKNALREADIASQEGKSAVLVMQSTVEELRTNEGGFNQQIAQLTLDIDFLSASLFEKDGNNQAAKEAFEKELQKKRFDLNKRILAANGIIRNMMLAIFIIPVVFVTLYPSYEDTKLRYILAPVAFFSCGVLAAFFNGLLKKVVERYFRSERKYIDGLEAASKWFP